MNIPKFLSQKKLLRKILNQPAPVKKLKEKCEPGPNGHWQLLAVC